MLHPDYTEGDGELLWNIYYGDFSDDERFDAFRKDQLWDASVIRPMIEMDKKYRKFQLAYQDKRGLNDSKTASTHSYSWLLMICAALIVAAGYMMWQKYEQKKLAKFIEVPENEGTAHLLKPYATFQSGQEAPARDIAA